MGPTDVQTVMANTTLVPRIGAGTAHSKGIQARSPSDSASSAGRG